MVNAAIHASAIRTSSRARIAAGVAAVALGGLAIVAQRAAPPPLRPGVIGGGITLLPNGWRIAPAGKSLMVGDLPLAMVQSPDRRYLVISNNGWSKPTLTVVDMATFSVRSRVSVDHAWLGLAWHPDGKRLFSSGAAQNTINQFSYDNSGLKSSGQFVLGRPALNIPDGSELKGTGFVGGLAVSSDGSTLYAAEVLGRGLAVVDLARGKLRRTIDLPAEPYTVLLSKDGRTLFVSLWGGSKVLALDPATLASKGEVEVGEHPNAMAISRDGARLFVACANTNKVWIVDTRSLTPTEQISVTPFPDAPPGTTPNGLDVSPDGKTLAVANADNNSVALIDITAPGASVVQGFIPTGWYPTAVLFDNSNQLFVLNGKGLTGQANPRGPQPVSPTAVGQYSGQLLQGAISVIPMPNQAELKILTERVLSISAYTDAHKLTPADPPVASPIPKKVGDPSPIRHVFYVIRENRSYDQILGDMEKGNGDPTLTLFGEEVTPNAHALAREFVLMDNFYVNAEVSYDGHAFSTGAYATDVVEKLWPTNYASRGAVYLSGGGWGLRNPFGNLSAPPAGYIWDFANRAGVSVRSYGEFAERKSKGGPFEATVPGLVGKVHPGYPSFDLAIPDNDRLNIWLSEFRQFEQNGTLPRLSIIRLPNDHTNGTRAGSPTPRAMIAENDVALGRLVEAISQSRYWNESAIFVLEDDAQNGPDHVDSHRSPALVVSPFVKRGALDSTLYTTSGMLRTMELVLGLPPMSQYDAAATPMYAAFQAVPNLAPYQAKGARISLTEQNNATSWGSAASAAMNFREADRAPEHELNEILWKSVRGAASEMPPPVRAGFVRPLEKKDADDN
jgi:DNA-binding beta-propeller fold protein YncE